MTVSLPLPVEIVSQTAQLDAAVKAMLGSQDIALDTESNSFHRYPEQLCLIQIATRHRVYVIDTIVLKDIASLKEALDASITKVVHGADYDIRSLDQHYGFRIRNLYDTNIAARFAGLTRVGLAALIEDLLGVTISKSKRLQRADWGQRPLSTKALDYAAADVRHLFAWKRYDMPHLIWRPHTSQSREAGTWMDAALQFCEAFFCFEKKKPDASVAHPSS